MGKVHANDLFALRNLEVFPSGTLLASFVKPVLIHHVLTFVIDDSKAIDTAICLRLIDIDISDTFLRINWEVAKILVNFMFFSRVGSPQNFALSTIGEVKVDLVEL